MIFVLFYVTLFCILLGRSGSYLRFRIPSQYYEHISEHVETKAIFYEDFTKPLKKTFENYCLQHFSLNNQMIVARSIDSNSEGDNNFDFFQLFLSKFRKLKYFIIQNTFLF